MTLVSRPTRNKCSNPSRWVPGTVLGRGKLLSPCVRESVPTDRKSLALAEMRLTIAKLLWNFDMECQTDGDWMDQSSYMLWEKKPLMMKLIPVGRIIHH